MGIEKVKGKYKFTIKTKYDCIIYLGHIIEYIQKKIDIVDTLFLKFLDYISNELNKQDIKINNNNNELLIWLDINNKNNELKFDFYEFKLFDSAIEHEISLIINLIGDYSQDKKSISFNNYMSILKKRRIADVKFFESKSRDLILEHFRNIRNYKSHFTADKFCEWILFREKQIKENPKLRFNTGTEFNISIYNETSYQIIRNQVFAHNNTINKIKKILEYMKREFEVLIGDKVQFNKNYFDEKDLTSLKISKNGFKSHMKNDKLTK